jgi:predicted methyltransferase
VGEVAASSWRDQQAQFIAQIARILRPGGRALLVVGDGVVDGRAENAPDGVAEAGAAVGLEPIARASQVRALHDRRLAEIFAAHPRREHLLLLEKKSRG